MGFRKVGVSDRLRQFQIGEATNPGHCQRGKPQARVAYWLHTGCVLGPYGLRIGSIRVVYWLHTGCVLSVCSLCSLNAHSPQSVIPGVVPVCSGWCFNKVLCLVPGAVTVCSGCCNGLFQVLFPFVRPAKKNTKKNTKPLNIPL